MMLQTWRATWLSIALVGAPVAVAAQDSGFRSPSGNLHCMLTAGVLRCDVLRSTAPRPPRPRDCDLEYGDAFELRATGRATRPCHGDTVADPRNPVLPYGTSWQGAGLRCEMAPTGVTCTNRDGRGFRLRSASQELF